MVRTDSDEPAAVADVVGLSRVLLAALEGTRSATCITTAELDPPGPEIVYVNPAYCAMTGRDRHSVIGSTPRAMQGPLTDRTTLDRLRSDLEAGRRFSGETVNYRADGEPFIINWSIDPVVDGDGVVTHYVATQEDVTARVRAAQLLDAEKQLELALTRILNCDARTRPRPCQELVGQVVAGGSSRRCGGIGRGDRCRRRIGLVGDGGHATRTAGLSVTFPFDRPGSTCTASSR